MYIVRLAGDNLYGNLLFTWLSLLVSMIVSFCAFLFPMRCLGWDLWLSWVSFWGFSHLLFSGVVWHLGISRCHSMLFLSSPHSSYSLFICLLRWFVAGLGNLMRTKRLIFVPCRCRGQGFCNLLPSVPWRYFSCGSSMLHTVTSACLCAQAIWSPEFNSSCHSTFCFVL